jgi:hypothetical protein
MRKRPIPTFVLVASALALTAHAEDEPSERLAIGGFVDGYYAYNDNRPVDHANFFPGVGTSGKRDNEFAINLAQLDVVMAPAPVGFKLSLGFGNSVDVVHAAEVDGVATSSDVWRHVVQASVQWQTEVGRGLLLEAGVYPSHIGFEAFQTKDNWNYTHSWLGELSPYYQTGVKAAYPFGEHWSGQLHVVNGWQMIGDNNRGKSIGAQIARSGDRLSFSINGWVGPEQPDNDDDLRTLLDTVVTWEATPAVTFGLSVDAAREERMVGPDARWQGAGLYARIAPPDWRTAFAARAEYYDDEDGAIAISGIAQTLKELTLTVEHRPIERLIVKLEGRYDRSTEAVFTSAERDAEGDPIGDEDQLLVLVGVVATF